MKTMLVNQRRAFELTNKQKKRREKRDKENHVAPYHIDGMVEKERNGRT
jgi:hypothetical protein